MPWTLLDSLLRVAREQVTRYSIEHHINIKIKSKMTSEAFYSLLKVSFPPEIRIKTVKETHPYSIGFWINDRGES